MSKQAIDYKLEPMPAAYQKRLKSIFKRFGNAHTAIQNELQEAFEYVAIFQDIDLSDRPDLPLRIFKKLDMETTFHVFGNDIGDNFTILLYIRAEDLEAVTTLLEINLPRWETMSYCDMADRYDHNAGRKFAITVEPAKVHKGNFQKLMHLTPEMGGAVSGIRELLTDDRIITGQLGELVRVIPLGKEKNILEMTKDDKTVFYLQAKEVYGYLYGTGGKYDNSPPKPPVVFDTLEAAIKVGGKPLVKIEGINPEHNYLIFVLDSGHHSGYLKDLRATWHDKEEAITFSETFTWSQVVDRRTHKAIFQTDNYRD